MTAALSALRDERLLTALAKHIVANWVNHNPETGALREACEAYLAARALVAAHEAGKQYEVTVTAETVPPKPSTPDELADIFATAYDTDPRDAQISTLTRERDDALATIKKWEESEAVLNTRIIAMEGRFLREAAAKDRLHERIAEITEEIVAKDAKLKRYEQPSDEDIERAAMASLGAFVDGSHIVVFAWAEQDERDKENHRDSVRAVLATIGGG